MHLAYFPKPEELTDGITEAQRAEAADWQTLVPVRHLVLKALDNSREDRVIGSSLEAAVVLQAGPEIFPLLKKYESHLPAWFIVSEVEVHSSSSEGLDVAVERAHGDKCERCWKFTMDVGSDSLYPTVCASCAAVLREFYGESGV